MEKYCRIVATDGTFETFTTVQDEYPKQWTKSTLTYAVIKGTRDLPSNWQRQMVSLAMTMWDIEIEVDLKLVKISENPDIRIYFKTSEEEKEFRDSPSTLAYAYYPNQGELSGLLVMNDDYWWNNTGKMDKDNNGKPVQGYNGIAVIGHEMGHILGLSHSVRNLGKDLLDPYYNNNQFLPSDYDITRMLKKYPVETNRGFWHNSRLRSWLRARILRLRI